MFKLITPVIALSLSALVGCTASYETGEYNSEYFNENLDQELSDFENDAPQNNLDDIEDNADSERALVAAELNGDFPGVQSEGSASLNSSFDGYSTYVDASLFNDDGALMALIDIYSSDGLADPAFQPGSRTVFENGRVVEGASYAEVYVANCAGESSSFDIDEPADEVIIEAEEGAQEGDTVVTIMSRSDSGNLETTLLVR